MAEAEAEEAASLAALEVQVCGPLGGWAVSHLAAPIEHSPSRVHLAFIENSPRAHVVALLAAQVWLETDLLLRTLADLRNTRMAVPAQALGLLPPPPAGGWPETFALAGVNAQMKEKYDGAKAEGEVSW